MERDYRAFLYELEAASVLFLLDSAQFIGHLEKTVGRVLSLFSSLPFHPSLRP